MAIIITTTGETDEEEEAAKQEKRKKIRYNIYDIRKTKKERSRKRVRPKM